MSNLINGKTISTPSYPKKKQPASYLQNHTTVLGKMPKGTEATEWNKREWNKRPPFMVCQNTKYK